MTRAAAPSPTADYPIRPVPFTEVSVEDAFWRPRLETNRAVTVPYTLGRCEDTGRVLNFARAAGRASGPHEGVPFNDSDVFKVIEGASLALHTQPDAELEAELDRLVELIGAAQEPDGYLYTPRTIGEPPMEDRWEGPERWSNLYMSHELYNLGHLYEAAAAHAQATGKRSLLDIALRTAELVLEVFGEGGRFAPPGHQEIELGLVKLYRVTGDLRLLAMARRFLDTRGRAREGAGGRARETPGERAEGRALYGPYSQDHAPVTEQREAVGHAVRAGYMYSAMADVAALDDAPGYLGALDAIWQDVVGRKLYLTGGVGALHEGEAFGEAYHLPNATAYAETCAAIANVMWNHRMFLLHGEARYLDVLERTLYNGMLSGVSLGGDLFFYPNPLASDGSWAFNVGEGPTRSPWFEVSCCPTNVVRALPALPGYLYAVRERDLYVNLYVGSRGRVTVDGVGMRLSQTTDYPWDGTVRLELAPDEPMAFALKLRVPGWARGEPVPSDLYRYVGADEGADGVRLRLNGAEVEIRTEHGFATLDRTWRPGDVVELELPMPVRRVLAHDAVEDDRGRVAVERGPIVYCAEGIDNGGKALDLVLRDDAHLEPRRRDDLLEGVVTISGGGVELVPYYAWSHRGPGEMAVWLRRG